MDHLTLLEGEVDAMVRAIGSVDPAAPVPGCPGWTVRALVAHLIGVHRWARAALDRTTPPPFDERPITGDLAETYAEASQDLLARLRELAPSSPAWTLVAGDRTAGFWMRRQLHEVAVHRWDTVPYDLADDVAGDGIAEVLEVLLPRQIALGRTSLPGGGLQLTTGAQSWTLGSPPFQVLRGTAGELLLRLWGRGEPLPGAWCALTP